MRGGIEVQSSQRRAAKIMTVLNGEEEPPAVKLTLVVTLEEQGMLSSDLPIFGCFIVCWGFFFFLTPFLWFLGVTFREAAAPQEGTGCCRVG